METMNAPSSPWILPIVLPSAPQPLTSAMAEICARNVAEEAEDVARTNPNKLFERKEKVEMEELYKRFQEGNHLKQTHIWAIRKKKFR